MKDIQKNKTAVAIAVLAIILVAGVGIFAFSDDFGIEAPEEGAREYSTTSGEVSINILPNPNSEEGGE